MSRSDCVARISCPVRTLGDPALSGHVCLRLVIPFWVCHSREGGNPALGWGSGVRVSGAGHSRENGDPGQSSNDTARPHRPFIRHRKCWSRPACSLTSRIAFAPYHNVAEPYETYASIFALIVGTKSAMRTRVCSIVSRSRMVTVSSCEVWPSMVTQYGVPISSMRRYRLPTAPEVS